MEKDFECIIIDTDKEEYEMYISSDAFLSESTIRSAIAEKFTMKKADDINIARIDVIFKITLKEKEKECAK